MLNAFLSMTLFAAAAAVQPGPAASKLRAALIVRPLAITTVIVSATPATISFTGTNPATAQLVPGSPAAVTWSYKGSKRNTWNLTVSGGGSTTFGSCTTVPISAVTVTCASASQAGNGQGTAVCSAPFQLSNGATQVAGGTEDNGSTTIYTVNLTFTLKDSWQYMVTTGQTCSLTLTYDATLQ